MPILHDIKMTIATAVAAAGVSLASPALAQDAEYERAVDRTEVTVSDSVYQQVPQTQLKFRTATLNGRSTEITPDLVRQYAAQDQVKAPVAREDKVYEIQTFLNQRDVLQRDKRAAIMIGVVVEDAPYTPIVPGYDGRDQFRAVHKSIARMITGYDPDIDMEDQVKGPTIGEIYGAEVQAIFPLRHIPGATFRNPNGSTPEVRVNDIIIIVNNQFIPIEVDPPHHFPDTVEEMEEWLKHYLDRDMHLYSKLEYEANREAILANADRKYSGQELFPAADRRGAGIRGEGSGQGAGTGTIAAANLD